MFLPLSTTSRDVSVTKVGNMRSFGRALARSFVLAGLVIFSAGLAEAKSACVADASSNYYMFSKVKLPKTAGDATTLQGMYLQADLPESLQRGFSGVAVRRRTGDLRISLFVHSTNGVYSDFTVTWVADDLLQGTAIRDLDGDFNKDDATDALTTTDCATIPYP